MQESATWIQSEEQYLDVMAKKERKLILRFLRKPIGLIGTDKIEGLRTQRMRLEGEVDRQRAVDSEEPDSKVFSEIACDALIRSIGYQSIPIDGVPFDTSRSIIPNDFGCVKDPSTGEMIVGLYCAGWVKRGPVGIIDATLRDSLETFRVIKHHLEHRMLKGSSSTTEDIKQLLSSGSPLVDKQGWLRIN